MVSNYTILESTTAGKLQKTSNFANALGWTKSEKTTTLQPNVTEKRNVQHHFRGLVPEYSLN